MAESSHGDVWMNTDMWDDPRWIALTSRAQMLYMGILMYPRVVGGGAPAHIDEVATDPDGFPGFGSGGSEAPLADLIDTGFVALNQDTGHLSALPWEHVWFTSDHNGEEPVN